MTSRPERAWRVLVVDDNAQDFVGTSWMTAGSMARAADNAHDLRGPLNIMLVGTSVLEGQVAESVRTLPEKMHPIAPRPQGHGSDGPRLDASRAASTGAAS